MFASPFGMRPVIDIRNLNRNREAEINAAPGEDEDVSK